MLDTRPVALTPRGRIRATLSTLERRWDELSDTQRAHVLELLADLSAAIRADQVRALRRPA
jgi:hypothetical protein